MKKANQIPLKIDYDKQAMRKTYSQFLKKKYNTDSDDSEYENKDVALMIKRQQKSLSKSGGANRIMNRAM